MVGGEIEVGQPVVVEVSDSHAATVVEVEVFDDVEAVGRLDPVDKLDAGLFRRQQREQAFLRGLAKQESGQTEKSKHRFEAHGGNFLSQIKQKPYNWQA